MASATSYTAHVYIKGHDLASSAFTKVSKNVNAVTGKINAASRKIQNFGRTVTANAAMPLAVVTAASMKSAYNFSEAINQVAATAQLSEKRMAPYTNVIREFGRTTQFTAVDAAKGFNYLLQAGSTLDEAVALLPDTLNLAAAGAMSLAKAADYSTNAFAGFGLASNDVQEMRKNMTHLNDVVAYTATKANTNVPQMFMAMKEAGPVSAALGISLEKTAAILGVFGNNGFQGAAAGRSFRTGMLRLIAPTKKARKAFADLGIDTNKYFNESNKINGSKLANALSSQGIKVKGGVLQDILENSTSDDLLGELVDKVIGQVGDKSVEAREKISQTIADSFAANAEGLDIFALFKEMKNKDAGTAHMEAIFGKMQVAKFLALLNTEAKKGYDTLHKSINDGAEGASKKMADTQMRGMVGGVKRFESVVEGLNLSIWDSGLADDMTNSLAALTGVISNLTDSDIESIYSIGKGIAVIAGLSYSTVAIAKVGTALVTLGGGLAKAAAGALLFSPYVIAGSALLLGLGYLASAYEKEGKSSQFAARAEKEHADQLERVDSILGSANKNSLKYGENIDQGARHKLNLEVAKLDKQIPQQRKEIIGNLKTEGFGSLNEIANLDSTTKAEINKISDEFNLGKKSIKETADVIFKIANRSKENTVALDTVIKNLHALGLTSAAKKQKEILLNPGKISKEEADTKINSVLTTVSLLDNDEYLTIVGQIKAQKALLEKLNIVPVSKGVSHFKSYTNPDEAPMMFGNTTEKANRINTEKAELSEMQLKIQSIKAAIDQQNIDRKSETVKAELKGQADVRMQIRVHGAEITSSSVSTTSSGHIRAKANVGTSMPELNQGQMP